MIDYTFKELKTPVVKYLVFTRQLFLVVFILHILVTTSLMKKAYIF